MENKKVKRKELVSSKKKKDKVKDEGKVNRKVRVNSKKNKVKSITPLTDKPDGMVRMPDYYRKLADGGKPTRISWRLSDIDLDLDGTQMTPKKPAKIIEDDEVYRRINL